MYARRSTLLLILMVIMPLALLAWLGTYLVHDGERRAKSTHDAIVGERLQTANHQLISFFRGALRQLDQLAVAAEEEVLDHNRHAHLENARLLSHEWVLAASCLCPNGRQSFSESHETVDLSEGLILPLKELAALPHWPESPTVTADQAFLPMSGVLPLGWQAFILGAEKTLAEPGPHRLCGLLTRQLGGDDPQAIYWAKRPDGSVSGILLNMPRLLEAAFANLPPPGLKPPPGMMLLGTDTGRSLHTWGQLHADPTAFPDVSISVIKPFHNWSLGYVAAPGEFPTALLFPILLGVTSGSLLVPSLAWMFFRESTQELRLAQQRVSFVNQVSHELKTPLTNIQLYAEMARTRAEAGQDEVSTRQLAVVESETARLNRLIQNVLSYARMQRNRLSVQPKRIDLVRVVTEVTERWRPLLEKRQIETVLVVPEGLTLTSDEDALAQILDNLLSNIEKYAAGGRHVGIGVERQEKSVLVTVEDRGPGIPAGKQDLIFEPFERLRSDLQEGVTGTGIGLTISREIAALLGGTLRLDASYREGARFVLSLPGEASTPEKHPEIQPQTTPLET